jgi:hypothetical protein
MEKVLLWEGSSGGVDQERRWRDDVREQEKNVVFLRCGKAREGQKAKKAERHALVG